MAMTSQDDGYFVGTGDLVTGLTPGLDYTLTGWVNPESPMPIL